MESSQKILKELSDLTRNLDVFTRNIKSSNKEIIELQKSAAKIAESPVKKTADSAKKSTVENKPAPNKSTDVDAARGTSPLKKTGLEAIKSDGASFLKGGSLKDSIKSGLFGGLSEGAKNLASSAIRGSSVQTRRDELKEKERVSPNEKKGDEKVSVSESKEKKSSLEKLNTTEKKKAEVQTAQPEKKPENKGFFAGLIEKISQKKEEAKKVSTTPSGDNKGQSSGEAETPRKRGILSSLLEMRRTPKSDEQNNRRKETTKPTTQKVESPSAVAKSEKVPLESLAKVSSTAGDIKTKIEPEGNSKAKKSITLGGLAKKALDKILPPREGKSEMKKEEQSLKSEVPKSAPAQPDPVKAQPETMPSTAQPLSERTGSPAATSSASQSSDQSPTKSPEPAGKPAEGITSQDIQDIKSLLSSISSTLSGPLTIKDNKPFRPGSNMLG